MFVEKYKHKKYRLLIILAFAIINMLVFSSCSRPSKPQKDKPVEGFNNSKMSVEELRADRHNKRIASFKELDMHKEPIDFSFEGKPMNFKLPVYTNMNRYYLPLTEIAYNLGGEADLTDNNLNLSVNGKTYNINVNNNTYKVENNEFKFTHKLFRSGDVLYISLFDLTKMMNLKTSWNYDKKTISLFNNMDKITVDTPMQSGRPALVRLEDISVSEYHSEEQLEKLRIIADYLYSKNVPFHLAWIPRSIRPADNYDQDLTVNENIINANFLYTLDYMIDKNAVLGLHGYTHQHGDEVTAAGVEFSSTVNAGEKETRERVEKAIDNAKKLNLQYYFFESPHYAASPKQLGIMEQYFDIMYQPRDPNVVVKKKVGDRTVRYIPTPLDYLVDKNYADTMLKKIDTLKSNAVGSFFFHPVHEMSFIKLDNNANGYPTYTYPDDGILKRLVTKMQSKGFKFERVTSLQ